MTKGQTIKAKAPRVSAREVALTRLVDIQSRGSYANLGLDEAFKGLETAERALATQLINGVLRHRGQLDWVLNEVLNRSARGKRRNVCDLPPRIAAILRLGAFQVLFLDRIPASAAVNEAVRQAGQKASQAGLKPLVNAVLRQVAARETPWQWPVFADAPLDALMWRYSLPEWLSRLWLERFGPEAEALATWSVAPPRLCLRVNTLRCDRQPLCEALTRAMVPHRVSTVSDDGVVLDGPVVVTELPGYDAGWFYVQDEAAMLVVDVLGAAPGELVIDVGAAPGGKTTHLAQCMRNEGQILAVDVSAARLKLVERNCERLGVKCVRVLCGDGQVVEQWPVADRILLDVPCSGLGVLPRKPDLRFRQTPVQIEALLSVQQGLLVSAARRLKLGGTMVYSTCTINLAENQAQVRAFLSSHPDFELGDLTRDLPEAWRVDCEDRGMIQLLPHRHGVDGFFVAKLIKKGDR